MAKKIKQEYILKVVSSGLKEVTKEIRLLNNNLTGSNKAVDDSGKAFNTAGKKQDTYLRGLKGAAHATNNQTKGFSKMAQNLNGTLVPAYATVAANVFALTAAFGALKRAADLDILVSSAEAFAVQTGRSLTALSKDMQDITNSTITMKDALESASIAASAGFDNTTIKELTQVARNASVALGRDMTDSLNRVFKGAIKAEPELLDELGIILRLDTASRNYAAALGKSANSLTTFEKQQAVVNAVLEQGTEKFGEFADVDVNPFTQLSAAFHDISAVLIQIINIPISPVLKFFTENVAALTAVILLFSDSILKRAFPELENFADLMKTKLVTATDSAAKAYEKAKASNISFSRSLEGTDKASRVLLTNFSKGVADVQKQAETSKRLGKNFREAFSVGTDSVAGLTAYKKGLQQTIRSLDKLGAKTSQGFATKDIRFLKEELSETNLVLDKMKTKTIALSGRLQSFGKGAAASMAYAKTQVIAFGAEITKGATRGALAGYTAGFTGISTVLGRITKQDLPLFTKGVKLAVTSVAGLGGAFLKMLPIIGQLVFAWTLLSSAFTFIKDLLLEKDLVDLTETLGDNTKALATAAKSAEYYNKRLSELPDTIDNIDKKAKLLSNTFGTLADNLNKTLKDIDIADGFSGFDSLLDAFALGDLDEFKDQLESARTTMETFGFQAESNALIAEFGDLLRLSGEEAQIAGARIEEASNKIRKASLGALDLNNLIKTSFEGLGKGLLQLNDGLPALTGIEKGFFNLSTILSSLDVGNVQQVTSAITGLNDFELRELGLKGIADDITVIDNELKGLTKSQQGYRKELSIIQKERDRAAKFTDTRLTEALLAETEHEFTILTGLVDSYGLAIDKVTNKLSKQSEGIIKQLTIVRERFEAIKNAQREIADIRSKAKVGALEQNQGLEKRLEVLNKITQAENNYLATIDIQTNKMISSVKKSLLDIETQLNSGVDLSTKTSLLTDQEAKRSKLQQFENDLLENRNKTVDNYIKQIKVVQKELSKNTKFAAAGLTAAKTHTNIVQKDMYDAWVNLGIAQKLGIDKAKEQADHMTRAAVAAESYKAFLQEVRMPNVSTLISDISGMDARLEILDIESKYLEDNNTLLSARIDKEFILARAINDRLLTEAEFKVAELEETDPSAKLNTTIAARMQLNALELKALKIEETRKKVVDSATKAKLKGMKTELKLNGDILKLGVLATKKQINDLKIQAKLNKLRKAGFNDVEDFEKTLKDTFKTDYAKDFNAGIADMIDGMSNYGNIITELNDDLENLDTTGQKFTAGLKALSNIGAESGNNVTKSFADLALVVDVYNEKLNAGTMGAREWAAFTSTALGAISQLYEEGSSGAKAMAEAQKLLAVVSATIAVLEQGKGDPYTAFARMAAMAASVASLLSSSGIGGFGSSISGASAAEDYKETIGSQGLVGVDLETVSLTESIDDLVSTTTSLFSVEHELVVAISSLGDLFSQLAMSLLGSVGDFEASDFGVTEGSYDYNYDTLSSKFAVDPISNFIMDEINGLLDDIGFSDKSVSTKVIDSGIRLGASVEALGDSLVGSLDTATQYMVAEIATTTSSWWGLKKSTDTVLKTYYAALPDTFENELSYALDRTLLVITDLFQTFGQAVSVDLEKLFSDVGVIDMGALNISLEGKNAEEQSEAIAAWFSNMGNEVIAEVIPFIDDYALAGEELLDTLIRITNTTIELSNAFKQVDLSISAISDTSTIDFSGMTDAAAEQLKLEMVAAWQESFLENFTDMDEFTELFAQFSNAIFSETELLEIAFDNSTAIVNDGFTVLREQLTDTGNFDLLNALGTENTDEALRAVYDLGVETNAFAAVVDSATGEIDTSGADLLTILVQLGAAIDDQSVAADELTDVLENLNEQYERQIALFGLLGKELELLQLSFDFEDALKEAEETGTDLALVETYYGLLRLDIIREYNQQIVDAIEDSMKSITDSILTVVSSSEVWNEVAYQSIIVSKTANKLAASLGNLGDSIDFTVFDDLTDTTDFLDTFGEFIDTTVNSADTIEEQISLVNDLEAAVMDRYTAEVEAMEELEDSILDSISSLRDLSEEIGNFLDDLFVGDLSPLTASEQLAEAQIQFDENLLNVLSEDSDVAAKAAEDLLSSASTLLELSNSFWSIGPEYEAVFNSVVAALEGVDQALLDQIQLSEETLAINSLEIALTELQLETITQLQTLDSILTVLEEQNTLELNAELALYAAENVANLTAITDKLSEINNDSWNPIYLELVDLNATMSGMGSFAKGSEEISYDQVAMIHKGETILTADTSNAIRSGESIYGTTDALPTMGGNGDNNSEVVDAIRILTQVVATGQEDIIDKNEEVRVATRSISNNYNTVAAAGTKGIV
jgi:hypothetical protein